MRGIKRTLFAITSAFACALFVPPIIGLYFAPVEFNQFLIQKLRISSGQATSREVIDTARSAHSLGLNFIQHGNYIQPDYDNQEEMFAYIFSMLPTYAIVYPTEGFYYWNTTVDGHGEISGNIRLADLDKGRVSFAYFRALKASADKAHYFEADAAKGLEIRKLPDYWYQVTFRGKSVRFKMPMEDAKPAFALLPSEQMIGRIHDESGIRLYLLYNSDTYSFYEVLDENGGLTESLNDLGDGVLIGSRTGFTYFNDQESARKVLIGVHSKNVEANNYLDGPGDQVPYWPNIRERLHIAYPTTLLGEGIDEHGVYQGRDEWVRIAVSPYERYSTLNPLISRVKRCAAFADKNARWTCLTKEWWNSERWLNDTIGKIKRQGKQVPEEVFIKLKQAASQSFAKNV